MITCTVIHTNNSDNIINQFSNVANTRSSIISNTFNPRSNIINLCHNSISLSSKTITHHTLPIMLLQSTTIQDLPYHLPHIILPTFPQLVVRVLLQDSRAATIAPTRCRHNSQTQMAPYTEKAMTPSWARVERTRRTETECTSSPVDVYRPRRSTSWLSANSWTNSTNSARVREAVIVPCNPALITEVKPRRSDER